MDGPDDMEIQPRTKIKQKGQPRSDIHKFRSN